MNSRTACAIRRFNIGCPLPEVIVSYERGFELHADLLPYSQQNRVLPREKLRAVNSFWRARCIRKPDAVGQIGVEPCQEAVSCAATFDGPFELALHIWVLNRIVVERRPDLGFGQ